MCNFLIFFFLQFNNFNTFWASLVSSLKKACCRNVDKTCFINWVENLICTTPWKSSLVNVHSTTPWSSASAPHIQLNSVYLTSVFESQIFSKTVSAATISASRQQRDSDFTLSYIKVVVYAICDSKEMCHVYQRIRSWQDFINRYCMIIILPSAMGNRFIGCDLLFSHHFITC